MRTLALFLRTPDLKVRTLDIDLRTLISSRILKAFSLYNSKDLVFYITMR